MDKNKKYCEHCIHQERWGRLTMGCLRNYKQAVYSPYSGNELKVAERDSFRERLKDSHANDRGDCPFYQRVWYKFFARR